MSDNQLSMSVGRDYRANGVYEYVIFRNEEVIAREGFFRNSGTAKRNGFKAMIALAEQFAKVSP
jgi:hypothetical protein